MPTLHPIVPKGDVFYVYDVVVFSNSFKTKFSLGARLLEDFRAIKVFSRRFVYFFIDKCRCRS